MTDALAAVLFDMDGLLVDTEPLWLETETEVMERLGGPWSASDQEALLGGSMARTVSYLLSKATRPQSPETVAQWMVDGMMDRACHGPAGRAGTGHGGGRRRGAVLARDVVAAAVRRSRPCHHRPPLPRHCV